MDSYEGRKLEERRRKYDAAYYKGPGLTRTTRRVAGKRNEEGIETVLITHPSDLIRSGQNWSELSRTEWI